MPQLQRTARIFVHENAFDRDNVRPVFANNTADRLENLAQPVRESTVDALDRAAGHIQGFVAIKVDDAEARQAGARVNSEYASFCRQINLRFAQVLLH